MFSIKNLNLYDIHFSIYLQSLKFLLITVPDMSWFMDRIHSANEGFAFIKMEYSKRSA